MRPGVLTILRKQLPHDAGTQSWDHGSGAHERSICGTYTYMYVRMSMCIRTLYIVHAYMYMACAILWHMHVHVCICLWSDLWFEDLHMHNLCNVVWHKIFRIYNYYRPKYWSDNNNIIIIANPI